MDIYVQASQSSGVNSLAKAVNNANGDETKKASENMPDKSTEVVAKPAEDEVLISAEAAAMEDGNGMKMMQESAGSEDGKTAQASTSTAKDSSATYSSQQNSKPAKSETTGVDQYA
ncbi:hypothetical protein ACFL2A_05510 [Thermodesulfobacteriota bacterium]